MYGGVKRPRSAAAGEPTRTQTRASTRQHARAVGDRLGDVLPHVLAFVSILDANALRRACRMCKTAVAEFPWTDTAPILNLAAWHAAFPRASAAETTKFALVQHKHSAPLGPSPLADLTRLTLDLHVADLLPPALESLCVEHSIWDMDALATQLEACRRLKELRVCVRHTEDAGLAAVLERCPRLATLELGFDMFATPQCIKSVASLRHLTALRLYRVALYDSPTAAALEAALAHAPLLTRLELDWPFHASSDGVARSLCLLPRLTHLGVSGEHAPQVLFGSLHHVPLLQTLCVTRCVLSCGEAATLELVAALPRLPALVELDLTATLLTPAVAHQVVGALARAPQLRILRVYAHGSSQFSCALPLQLETLVWEMVGVEHRKQHAAAALSLRLRGMPLRALALTQSSAHAHRHTSGATFAACLAEALPHMPHLVTLDLFGQGLGDAGVRHLLAVPRLPPYLLLRCNAIGDETCTRLIKRLGGLSHLWLALQHGARGAAVIVARGLKAASPPLAALTLEVDKLSPRGGAALLAAKGTTHIDVWGQCNAKLRRALARTYAPNLI